MSTPEGRNYNSVPRLNLLPPPRPNKVPTFLRSIYEGAALLLMLPFLLPIMLDLVGIPFIEEKLHSGWIAVVRALTGTRVRCSMKDAVKVAFKEAGMQGPGTMLIKETALCYDIYIQVAPSRTPDVIPCVAARILVNIDTGIVRSSEYVPCIHDHYVDGVARCETVIPCNFD